MAFTATQDANGLANLYGGQDMLAHKIDLDDEQKYRANVDRSDSVSATDALFILQFSVNKIQRF